MLGIAPALRPEHPIPVHELFHPKTSLLHWAMDYAKSPPMQFDDPSAEKAIHIAASHPRGSSRAAPQYAELRRVLKEHAADLGGVDPHGQYLKLAATLGDPHIVETLIELGARLDHPSYANDYSPLHYTMFHAGIRKPVSPDVIASLIRAGQDPNALDIDGDTPLHGLLTVAVGDIVACAKVLIDLGADPNAYSRASKLADGTRVGVTPLLVASMGGQGDRVALVDLLLRHRADPRLPLHFQEEPASRKPRSLIDRLTASPFTPALPLDPLIQKALCRAAATLDAQDQHAVLSAATPPAPIPGDQPRSPRL